MKVFDADKLSHFAAALVAQGYRVIAPVRDGEVHAYKPWHPGLTIETSAFTVNSAKDFLLPRSEVLARYSLDGDDFAPLEVLPDSTKTVLLCVRPCDAASVKLLDTVFNWDSPDLFYDARRESCTIVSLACAAADSSCFCTSVGQRPDGTSGADAILFPADGGRQLIFQEVTEKGRAIASAAAEVLSEGQAAADAVAQVPVQFDAQAVTAWLADNFDSPLWQELSLPCLGCGACAYACPCCHCFDIQDDAGPTQSVRYRTWDACGLALFTQHTSGHNPRPNSVARWRQRVLHKFSYIPQRFNLLGCTGCGRCTRLCPNGMAILEACQRIEQSCQCKPIRP